MRLFNANHVSCKYKLVFINLFFNASILICVYRKIYFSSLSLHCTYYLYIMCVYINFKIFPLQLFHILLRFRSIHLSFNNTRKSHFLLHYTTYMLYYTILVNFKSLYHERSDISICVCWIEGIFCIENGLASSNMLMEHWCKCVWV